MGKETVGDLVEGQAFISSLEHDSELARIYSGAGILLGHQPETSLFRGRPGVG